MKAKKEFIQCMMDANTEISLRICFIFVSIILTSCCARVDNTKNEGGVISRFDSYGNNCRYTIMLDGEFVEVIDSCGKYKIGDTLFISKCH